MRAYSLLSAALVGIVAFTTARPLTSEAEVSSTSSTSPNNNHSSPSSGDFTFPLANGFPNPPKAALQTIQKQAQGTLPNGPPPATLHAESETSLALIAFNELFEVAFFTELLDNITSHVPGYCDIPNRNEVLRTLRAVVAQEQLHELNANGAFTAFTGKTVQPCRYHFPVDNFQAAIALASTFTDLVLGTLADIQTVFAENDDNGLIRVLGAIIGQEGEQNGFYRHVIGKIPPALPFLTGAARDFAFNAILQNFVVPGSCPSLDLLASHGLKQFDVLKVLRTNFTLADVIAEFSLQATHPAEHGALLQKDDEGKIVAALTYINQQNVPFSVPMAITGSNGNGVYKFKAPFPGKSHDLSGLTIAAVTNGTGPFSTPDDVAAATLFGPGLIEVE